VQALWNEDLLETADGQKWGKMLLGAVALHLAIFSLVFLIPESFPTRRLQGTVYEVNLVEIPTRSISKGGGRPVSGKAKPIRQTRKSEPAKLVGKLISKERAVVIAKRVVTKKSATQIKPKESPTRLLDQAVSKIERKVKTREKDTLEQALSRIESKVKEEGPAPSGSLTGAQAGIAVQIYRAEVENRIKGNWAYPAAFMDPEKNKDLEALVVVTVDRDGTILKSSFEKPSGNAGFDESVRKAIERSNPLPPFPEGYLKTYEEIEINFNLRELEGG
jgi:colicin import membrane protein